MEMSPCWEAAPPNRYGHETPVGAVKEQSDGATRAEDPGRSEAKEAAKAVPTESEVAEPVGVYTVLFIPSPLCLQSDTLLTFKNDWNKKIEHNFANTEFKKHL
ncbi:hypothetical protein ACSFXN_05675 [Planococcus sp. 1R117A]|uniref:hypothetical protein n=1 Tax=Planococcus sp. 1R117A TaxID=3447020 RepID=UPI003EDC2BA0